MSLYYQKNHLDNPQLLRYIRDVEQDVLRMGALVEKAFRLSDRSLFERDLQAAQEIILLDKQIDRYYRQIELDCATIMTLQAPVAQDLRVLSAYMQLVRDLERIGDYATDVAQIGVKLFPYTPHPCLQDIKRMSHHAQLMLANSLKALADLDASAGNAIKHLDDEVDNAYEKVYQILASQKDIKGVVEPFLLLGLAIRHLERMADHATNIGQRVSYIVTGHRS